MSCDVDKAREGLENELLILQSFHSLHLRHSSFWFSKLYVTSPTSQLILQPFPRFIYVTTHSPTRPLLHLRHSSFSNPSLALPMSQLILQPFSRFIYVTTHSPTRPLLHLRHRSFSNPSFASPTSQALHLRHLASRLWIQQSSVLAFLKQKKHEECVVLFLPLFGMTVVY